MSCHATRRIVLASSLLLALRATAITDNDVPTIWDGAALEDWATPVATLNVRPTHFTPAEYYAAPAETWLGIPAGDWLSGSPNPPAGSRIVGLRLAQDALRIRARLRLH